ncbi:MAG: hypothetical protein OSB19_04460 [Opitutaceae bacterium]|nr:hypothetical protein [Opitutaceae bacterium]
MPIKIAGFPFSGFFEKQRTFLKAAFHRSWYPDIESCEAEKKEGNIAGSLS